MRTVELAKVVFAIAVLVVLHFLIYIALLRWLSPLVSVAIVLAIDLIVAGAMAYLALSNAPDPIEEEARQIKAQAVREMKQSLTVMAMTAEVAGTVLRTRARGGVRRGAATIAAELASRLIGR